MPCPPSTPRGRPRQPRGAPPPALVSGQWGTPQTHGKRLTLRPRGVLGAERLTPLGLTSSPAVVARVPLPVRQAWAPWGRPPARVCQDRARLRQRGGFVQAFYTVARPPMRLRRQGPRPERTRHGALCPRWRACTPAMAAGVTEHGWTFRELLTAQFEPWDCQSMSQ
jgi:hypothetical protein